MADTDRFGELASRIEAVAESLTELVLDVLREALESAYAAKDPADAELVPTSDAAVVAARNTERTLNRARASLEKAAGLLRRLEADEEGSAASC